MHPDLKFCFRSLSRFIYYVTDEEDRFIREVREILKDYAPRTHVYNAAFGLMSIDALMEDWRSRVHKESPSPGIHDALINIYKEDPRREQNFYIITDPEQWLTDAHVVRRILNIVHQQQANTTTVKFLVFVGPRLVLPRALQPYLEVIHDQGLSEDDIREIVEPTCNRVNVSMSANLVNSMKGLTSYGVGTALNQSLILSKREHGVHRVDPRHFMDYKRRQLRKTDLLSYVDVSDYTFEQVGGLHRFKAWIQKHKAAWTEEGQKFGLIPPKGVLLVGVWGCGKSLSVKALGNAWRLPVIQMDMGRLRTSLVGESEANVLRATSIIESVAPCVTGDTHVTLADGSTEPIEDLWYNPPEDFEVMCWDERLLKVSTTRVSAVTRRLADAFAVSAANGYQINATANHQHYVLRGGLPEWVRTDELTKGDMLAVPLASHVGNPDCLRFHPEGMRPFERLDGYTELRRGHGGFRDSFVSKLPILWSVDLGWLLGSLEGDGFIGKRSAIGFINTSEKLLDNFERILKDQFGLDSVRREMTSSDPDLPGLSEDPIFKPCWNTVVTNQLAAEFLQSARQAILTAPVDVRAAFLAGWVDADGCIGPEKIVLTVKGPKLQAERRRLARQIIQSLGVTPSKFDTCSLEVTGSRAVLLASKIRSYLALKEAKALSVTSSDQGFDRGMGFACGQLLQEARKASGIGTEGFKRAGVSTSVMWRHENGATPISERQMAKYLTVLGSNGREIETLLSAECRWVEIQSIKPIGVKAVYDLACEGTNKHSFFANGLITHNCILWLDEAEKGLSGGKSSNMSDSGTTARMIGHLSTWLQETKAPICLAMTANSLHDLPVEFIRRVNERFFFDMPTEDERVDILKIHLRKQRQDTDSLNLAELAADAKQMVGSEIEQAIQAALVESFDAGCESLSPEILSNELRKKPRIFKTLSEELKEILNWVGWDPECQDGVRARWASEPSPEFLASR